MDCLRPEMKQRRIERGAEDIPEEEQVTTAVKEEEILLIAPETTQPSNSTFLNYPGILFGALESFCRMPFSRNSKKP